MKFFIDSANIGEIRRCIELGLCDGVTTNPTLILKAGKNFKEAIKEILKLVPGPVSVEAVSDDSKGMIKEAEEFAAWGKNVVVKIPMTQNGIAAVRSLSKKGIKTNVTLVFSANQALIAAKAGATYVSPFIGRLDDQGEEGMQLVAEILDIYENYNLKTEIIVASVRHPRHVTDSALIGAHIATVPPEVFNKLFKHAKTDEGIKKFKEDWEKVRK